MTRSDTLSKYDNQYQRMSDWVAEYEVLPEFIPFPHRQYDPWELLLECQSLFDSLGDYQVTWTWGQTENHGKGMNRERMFRLAAAMGSYPIRLSGYKATKFTNPQYQNEIPQYCVLDPMDHIERCAMLGLLSGSDVADQFNKSHGWTWWACENAGKEWGAMREQGKERMGNSMVIAREWGGWTNRELAEALDRGLGTVSDYLYNYATLEEAPAVPYEKWATK